MTNRSHPRLDNLFQGYRLKIDHLQWFIAYTDPCKQPPMGWNSQPRYDLTLGYASMFCKSWVCRNLIGFPTAVLLIRPSRQSQ